MFIKANLRPKNFCLGLIRPKVSFMNMQEKQTSNFSKVINQQCLQKALKYKAMWGALFQTEA